MKKIAATFGQIDTISKRGTYTQLGYRSATIASREGRAATRAGGESHTAYHRQQLVDQSRQFMRDNGLYKGMIERAVSYIVANGFKLQARTRSKTFNARAEQLWAQYWKRPEIKGILSGGRLERQVARELLVAGDTLLIKTNSGLLQHVEADQITGPTSNYIEDGIIKSTAGKPLAFWIAPYSRGMLGRQSAEMYAADDCIFLTDPERPSGVRACPPLQASFPMLHRINDVCDSEAVAWQMLARLALSVTKENAEESAYLSSKPDPDKDGSEEGTLATRMTELDYALIFHGKPGEEIKGIDRNIPSQNFTESLKMFMRLLGLPIGLPLEIILLDWTNSNYSQSRAVLEQAYQTFIGWQQLLEDFFYAPVYTWKIQQWISAGLLPPRDDAYWHDWITPTFPWIDQLKETEAYGAKVDRGFATHAHVCKALNVEREDVINAKQTEVEEAIKIAQAITKATGVEVPWEPFAGMTVQKKDAKPAPARPQENPINE